MPTDSGEGGGRAAEEVLVRVFSPSELPWGEQPGGLIKAFFFWKRNIID
jgi:hypothetical protein